jgi:hypothetical protein
MFMRARWHVVLLLLASSSALSQTAQRVKPKKNPLALTPESLCLGFKNMAAITKQNFKEEADQLCPNFLPSATLTELIATPYQGGNQPVLKVITSTQEGGDVRIMVAYSMSVPKEPVEALLGEEKHVVVPYSRDPLTINASFGPPVRNLGDADTAFSIEQQTKVVDRVSFEDRSVHDLKLYRLHPNNLDFFAAVRTLREPTLQFKRSVVLRGVMRDPKSPDRTVSVSLLHFLMNGRDNPDRVIEAFQAFIEDDMKTLYSEQSSN